MISAITEGIQVSVKPQFQPFYSQPDKNIFVFSYTIQIENKTENSVKLLSREWDIFDSVGVSYQVKGQGVVGVNPVIEPGKHFKYTSGCNLNSTIGSMAGIYLMERIRDGKTFEIIIPKFLLEVPYILN